MNEPKDPFASGFMNLDQASKYLRIHKQTLYRLCKKNKLIHFRVGSRFRIPNDVVERLLKTT